MLDLQQPRRQSRKSILLYVFKNIRGLIAVLIYSAFGTAALKYWWVVLLLYVVVGLLLLVSPVLNYYFFTFHVENDELIIQKGVLNKERKAIPLERIQSVNINQNLIQRILQLVSVEVETAGSKAKELEIPGLSRSFAESFKNLLQDRARAVKNEGEPDLEDTVPIGQEIPTYSQEENSQTQRSRLLQLSLLDLLKVGITQNHLRSGGIALGVTVGFWYNIKDFIEQFYGNIFDGFEWEEIAAYATLSLLVVGIMVFIIFSIVVSIVIVINKYYGYTLERNGNYLEIQMGLLNRKEIKIPIEKIQILEFHTNPLRRLLNYNTAKIFQAQSEATGITSAEIPACTPSMVTALQEMIFNQSVLKQPQVIEAIAASHARLTSYILFLPMIMVISLMIYFETWVLGAAGAAFLVFFIYKSYRDGAATSIHTDENLVLLKSGWLFHSYKVVPIYKMQAVEKWRSIFLKRRRQIHINLHTAAGSRGLRYFDETAIASIKNFINNQVLLSNRNWM